MNETRFEITEPKFIGNFTQYACLLSAKEERYFKCIEDLNCVVRIEKSPEDWALIHIGDEYDADEAWHVIRTALEEEDQYVHLDKIWEDALWL